jgi:hypothetical protein
MDSAMFGLGLWARVSDPTATNDAALPIRSKCGSARTPSAIEETSPLPHQQGATAIDDLTDGELVRLYVRMTGEVPQSLHDAFSWWLRYGRTRMSPDREKLAEKTRVAAE